MSDELILIGRLVVLAAGLVLCAWFLWLLHKDGRGADSSTESAGGDTKEPA